MMLDKEEQTTDRSEMLADSIVGYLDRIKAAVGNPRFGEANLRILATMLRPLVEDAEALAWAAQNRR